MTPCLPAQAPVKAEDQQGPLLVGGRESAHHVNAPLSARPDRWGVRHRSRASGRHADASVSYTHLTLPTSSE
ncbi:MAG: hypothetical protein QUS35_01050, partial [bacterium]|nr:hypothetical protein [bacterium]